MKRSLPFLLAAWLLSAAALAGAAPACPPPEAAPARLTPQQEKAMAARAADRGVLWKLTRDGHSSYLFGTMHLGRPEWAYPGPSLRAAWRATDVLALEIDLDDPDTVRQLAEAMRSRTGPPLPAPLAERLRQQVAANCLPEPVAALHPMMQVTLLEMAVARRDGLSPDHSQEQMLAGMAQRDHRPLVGLESVAEQLGALLPDDAADTAAEVASALDELDDTRGAALLHRLTQDWAEGRLDDLERFPQWCECMRTEEERAAMRRLNDDRNLHLADRIVDLHAKGRRVLVAVGALHTTGPQALPRLLAQRGFQVERVATPASAVH